MADNINRNKLTGRHSFYSLKEIPWHRLGHIAQEAQSPTEVLKLAQLDYEVKLGQAVCNFMPEGTKRISQGSIDGKPMYHFYDEDGNLLGQLPYRGKPINGCYGIYRADTFDVFGNVGSKYEIVQNDASIDFIYAACKENEVFKKEDVIIQTAGALGKGETIFVTAKLPSFKVGKDDMDRYIVFTNTHDGSSSLTAFFTNIRVVCNNTLNMALRECTNKVSFRHTANIHTRLAEAAEAMNRSIRYTENLTEILAYAQTFKISDKQKYKFINNLFLNKAQKLYVEDKGGFENLGKGDDVIPTRTLNKLIDLNKNIDAGVGQNNYRGTAYWLYNGLTTYIQNGSDYKNQEDKFKQILNGSKAKLAQDGFNLTRTLLKA